MKCKGCKKLDLDQPKSFHKLHGKLPRIAILGGPTRLTSFGLNDSFCELFSINFNIPAGWARNCNCRHIFSFLEFHFAKEKCTWPFELDPWRPNNIFVHQGSPTPYKNITYWHIFEKLHCTPKKKLMWKILTHSAKLQFLIFFTLLSTIEFVSALLVTNGVEIPFCSCSSFSDFKVLGPSTCSLI